LGDQTLRSDFESSATHVFAERLSEPGGEQTVEVKWREIRNLGQRIELELLVEPPVDVLEHAMHAGDVFGLAVAICHRLSVHR